MKVFIGMETSGVGRRAFEARGHEVISCDLLPPDDGETRSIASLGPGKAIHVTGDVFATLDALRRVGWIPDLGIFHPTCTYLTAAAEWAYSDGPYHQQVKPGTLVGAERREARDLAIADVKRIWALPIKRKAIENPVGCLSSRWREPSQVLQPNKFGDDASKMTCLWLDNLPPLYWTKRITGRIVIDNGKGRQRYSNQTDSGQNALSPSDDRWKGRAASYPGILNAMAEQWGEWRGDLVEMMG